MASTFNFKVVKRVSNHKGPEDYPRGYERKLVGIESSNGRQRYRVDLCNFTGNIVVEPDVKANKTYISLSFTNEESLCNDYDKVKGDIVSINGVGKNLFPMDDGKKVYFQDVYDSASQMFKGIGRLDVEMGNLSLKLTHLRSDIPPANTVEYPPETTWTDNHLYVTGDGHYALIVPVTFTKKCLTDDPDDCIYCNRDISPNVWDFGRFTKIIAYDLTDSSKPPIEIPVNGYDSYLVPSPDYMQFAFSEGDKIGILDGKTLQVRDVEVR